MLAASASSPVDRLDAQAASTWVPVGEAESMSAITVQSILEAEKLLGLGYSEAERALMVDNLTGQVELAVKRRATALPRTLAPATLFDPRLPGFTMPPDRGFRPSRAPVLPLPEDDEDIAFAPVTTLAGWIRSGAITSTRLIENYLERIARLGPRLECIALTTPEVAREQAKRADNLLAAGTWLGPLHGIPWGCKDILDTAGVVTGWGAEPYRQRLPDTDAAVVRKLAAAGAVMVAKTTVGALAYGDIWYGGVTRNPWNRAEGSSGSSAGSASAVAAGLCAFAIGTETLGSIVAPSLRCGATGLRPTFGRVSRVGAMPLCWTLDKIGPICRTVEDTALVLAAISGHDADDPVSIGAPLSYDATADIRGRRVGYFPADFDASDAADLDKSILATAQELGLELVPLTHTDLPYDALMNTLFAEAAASFEDLTLADRDDELTWQEPGAWPNTFRKARFLSAVDHIQLDRLRRLVMQVMDEKFRGLDAMIGPALAGPMLIITNFTGHPSLILRSGFRQSEARGALSLAEGRLDQGSPTTGPVHTVPHGLCLWGRLFDEGTICEIGRALESALDVWDRRPPLGEFYDPGTPSRCRAE
jgi:Asp-tRNA(Asn)/Glu-tRNA(Gln) amidotransferase A subunit family amidase